MKKLVWALCVSPSILAAEPVAIRSGEHETFSRLVLSIPAGAEWEVSQDADGATITLPRADSGFETSTVFERIPKTRLGGVSQLSESQLQLELVCDCDVDAFLWRPDRLVVDIVDGPDVQQTVPLVMAPEESLSSEPNGLPNLLMMRQTPVIPELELPSDPPASSLETDIAETEIALIEGLARAATQGILDAAQPQTTQEPEQEPEMTQVAITPPIEAITTVSPHPGVGISTSLDRDLALLGAVLNEAVEPQCLPADLFAIREWAGEGSFHTQAAALIEALAGEFGQVPLQAQEDLARFYVSQGFGAEAMQVLAANEVSSQSRQVLIELAAMVDEMVQPFPLLASQAGCDTQASLWAFLIAPQPLDAEEANQIQQRFFDLPQPLRGHLSARLARAFVSVGDPDGAQVVLRATRNQDVENDHQTQATRAIVADEIGEADQAFELLSEEADDNARITPASIIRLIDLAIEQGQAPRQEDLLLAAALRQEFRNDPIADDLGVALARGQAVSGQYLEALDLLQPRNDDAAIEARNFAYSLLSENADVVQFLEVAYRDTPNDLTPETQNQIARRLIDLGFSERANDFLSGPAQREAAAERRYLRAEAAISLRDYASAIEALQGMSDARAREMRSLAYDRMGNPEAALSSLGAEGSDQDQATLQFRAQAWERLMLEDDDVLSSFAERVLETPTGEPSVTLADRRALLAQSAESRQAIENLLLRFDVPEPSDN